MWLRTFNGGNLAAFKGANYENFMVDSNGNEYFINSGVVSDYGDISLVVPAGAYPPNSGYGEYQVIDGHGHQSTVTPSRMFIVRVNGSIVETVILGTSNPDQDPVGYVVVANSDTVNLALRSSTPDRIAWK
jgi:hypothetical protein